MHSLNISPRDSVLVLNKMGPRIYPCGLRTNVLDVLECSESGLERYPDTVDTLCYTLICL